MLSEQHAVQTQDPTLSLPLISASFYMVIAGTTG